jgi:hypothetical protein
MYAVIIIDSIPRVAVYHALDWNVSMEKWRQGGWTVCGRGPVGEFRQHVFKLLDPARVRPCKRCY